MQNAPEYSTPFSSPTGSWPDREPLALSDGYATGVFHHKPTGPASRAPVLYLHGIQSHPGWFFASAASLSDAGHDVFQVARRGSGANLVDKGHARSAGQLLDDVQTAIRFVLDRTGAEKVALVGVSWGGKLAAAYCAKRDTSEIASLTLIAPGIAARVDVSLATKIKIASCLLAAPKTLVTIPLDAPELFTDNEPMRQFLRDDKLSLRKASVRFMYASRRLEQMISRAPQGSIKIPTTLILSDDDQIIDSPSVAEIIRRLTAQNAEIISLNGKHTLEFEEDPSEFHKTLRNACAK
ncbi:MAG: alpha/beta fold hydrolase [Phycisphaerales bacterium]|nr:alpha/beta fold hydrolase [Phycisphaerales bacterium]